MKLSYSSLKNRLKTIVSNSLNKIEILHTLDYDKKTIYLHNNIRTSSSAKEPETVAWIETFNKQDVVYDIGANIGAYSLIMASRVSRVYAIEPTYLNFNLLTKNTLTNTAKGTIPDNLTPLNVALSDATSLAAIHYSNLDLGGSNHQIASGGNIYNDFQPVFTGRVLCYRLDDLIETFKLEAPHHIKIDVDGIECLIIKGAVNTLKQPSLKSLMIEADQNSKDFSGICKLLSKDFNLKKSYLRHQSKTVANHLFVRR